MSTAALPSAATCLPAALLMRLYTFATTSFTVMGFGFLPALFLGEESAFAADFTAFLAVVFAAGFLAALGVSAGAALTSAVLPALTSTGFSGFAATCLAAVVPAAFTAVSAYAVVVVVVFFCLGMIIIPFNYPMARLHDAPCHSIYLS